MYVETFIRVCAYVCVRFVLYFQPDKERHQPDYYVRRLGQVLICGVHLVKVEIDLDDNSLF